MELNHSPYLKHLYVCVNQRPAGESCCGTEAGEAIKEKLKAFVKANRLQGKVRISSSGCMDLCAQGPNVMVYPDHLWYRKVTMEDVERIIQEHLMPLVPKPSPAAARSTNGIDAFLFDLGNVLVRFDHMAAAKRITAHAKAQPEDLYRLFFESPLVVEHDTGKISSRSFYEALRKEIGLSLPYEQFLGVWNDIFTPVEEMASLVKGLLKDYPCYLISNTNRPHFEYLLETCPILHELNGWILSYEVGVLKPHPAIYRRALEIAQAPAQRIFYVDDRQDLIDAGGRIGFQTHRFVEFEALAAELRGKGISKVHP